MPACARSTTTAPAGRRTSPATIISPSTSASAPRRCSPSMAARSPPTAGWPRRRWRGWRISSRAARRGPRKAPLPGGDMLWDGVETHVARALRTWPFLAEGEARRLVRAYGTRLDRVLGAAKAPRRPRALVRRALRRRGAPPDGATNGRSTADDVLWRRTKLGLRLSASEKVALARFMAGCGRYEWLHRYLRHWWWNSTLLPCPPSIKSFSLSGPLAKGDRIHPDRTWLGALHIPRSRRRTSSVQRMLKEKATFCIAALNASTQHVRNSLWWRMKRFQMIFVSYVRNASSSTKLVKRQ